jgi:hypothetical protein
VSLRLDQLIPVIKVVNKKEQVGKRELEEEEKKESHQSGFAVAVIGRRGCDHVL